MSCYILKKLLNLLDLLLKIFIVGAGVSFILIIWLVDRAWSPPPGTSVEHLHMIIPPNEEVECVISGIKLYRVRDSLNVDLKNSPNKLLDSYYFYHLLYDFGEDEKKVLLTYKFPYPTSGGRDVVIENTSLLIEESDSLVIVNYNKKPVGGFLIENNPFEKKIVMRYNSDLDNRNILMKYVDGKPEIKNVKNACF